MKEVIFTCNNILILIIWVIFIVYNIVHYTYRITILYYCMYDCIVYCIAWVSGKYYLTIVFLLSVLWLSNIGTTYNHYCTSERLRPTISHGLKTNLSLRCHCELCLEQYCPIWHNTCYCPCFLSIWKAENKQTCKYYIIFKSQPVQISKIWKLIKKRHCIIIYEISFTR